MLLAGTGILRAQLTRITTGSILYSTARIRTVLAPSHSLSSRDFFADTYQAQAGHTSSESQACACSKGRREFHTTTPVEGYKSGPRRPSWKYVNPYEKPTPKPPKGTRLPRFYVATETVKNATEGAVFQLSEAETKHALRVLRLTEGAWLEVCDGRGLLVEAQMRGLTYSNKAFATATSDPAEVPWVGPRWEVVAAMGTLQASRADSLVEKISELGACSLRPLLTQRSRTIGRFEEKDTIKVVEVEELSDVSEVEEEGDFTRTGRFARWQRVSVSAGKQSLRTHCLIIRPPCTLDALLTQIRAGTPAFVGAQGAPPLLDVLSAAGPRLLAAGGDGSSGSSSEGGGSRSCLLLVGPEGDFTEQEMKMLIEAGAAPVGLGQNRLRVETAAMAVLNGAVLAYESLKRGTELTAEQREMVA